MILTIDTALDACTVALLKHEVVAQMVHEPMTRGHADRLVPLINTVLDLAHNPHIDTIVVSIGPGSFTGLRIGIAAARALGFAWNVPVIGVSTMAALALAAREYNKKPVLVVHDAKRGHVYVQLFDGTDPLSGITVETPPLAADMVTAHKAVVVGTGAAHLPEVHTLPVNPFPMPRFMVACAANHPLGLEPLYVRPPDAKTQMPKH